MLDQHENFRNGASKVTSLTANPPFRWEEIDHSLVRLRLADLADEKRIHFDNRNNLNANTFPSLILNEERIDQQIRKTYEIYCDVWQKQGRAKSADFIRTVYFRGIVPAIHGRASAVASEFRMWAIRTSFSPELREAHLRSFHLKMLRFEDRWKRSMEAEAKECQHAARIAAAQAEARGTPGSATRPGDGLPQKTTRQEKIGFAAARGRDGGSIEQLEFSDVALLNTYESFAQTLAGVRAVVRENGNITVDELRKRLPRHSDLQAAAEDKHLSGFIEIFLITPNVGPAAKSRAKPGPKQATAKGTALAFLGKKTGLECSTIKKRLCAARKELKSLHSPVFSKR